MSRHDPLLYAHDNEAVTALCLSCTRENCTGDCRERRTTAGVQRAQIRPTTDRASLDEDKLSAREKEFLIYYDRGLCDRECAERMGVKEFISRTTRNKLGLPPNCKPGRPRKRREENADENSKN